MHVTKELLLERERENTAPIHDARIVRTQPLGLARHPGVERFSGDIRLQAANGRKPTGAPLLETSAPEARHELRRRLERKPQIGIAGEASAGSHADDRRRDFVDENVLADDRGRRAEAALPKCLGQHHVRMIGVVAIVFVGEKAAAQRCCAEHRKVTRAHTFAHDALGLGAPGPSGPSVNIERDLERAGNGREHVVCSAQIFEHGEGQRAQLELVALGRLPNLDEAFGLGKRKGVHHHSLNEAVDCSVRAETHTERQNRNNVKPGFFSKLLSPTRASLSQSVMTPEPYKRCAKSKPFKILTFVLDPRAS